MPEPNCSATGCPSCNRPVTTLCNQAPSSTAAAAIAPPKGPTMLTLLPAIDVSDRKAVRLLKGEAGW